MAPTLLLVLVGNLDVNDVIGVLVVDVVLDDPPPESRTVTTAWAGTETVAAPPETVTVVDATE